MGIIIKSSTELRNDYKRVSKCCKETGEPIFITVNGQNDTVIMSQQAYNSMVDKQDTAKRIGKARENRLQGAKGATIEELRGSLTKAIEMGKTDGK